MGDSTVQSRSRKATKPKNDFRKRMGLHPNFPLFPHDGRWTKKVLGKLKYFGKVADDPKGKAALELWVTRKDALLAGRTPTDLRQGLTVEDLADHFLNAKRHLLDTRELSVRTYADYFSTCKRLVDLFGMDRLVDDLRPEDFDKLRANIGKTRKAVALGNEIQRVRSVFRFALEQGLVHIPIRFGQGFKKPARKTMRKERAAKGSRMLESSELGATLAAADVQMRAMILLAANGALGQSDLSALPMSAINLDRGWLDYARQKTGIARRIPLWPETVHAVREAIKVRPKAKDPNDDDLLFITKYGQRWVKFNKSGTPADALGQEFAKLLTTLGIKRAGVSFYAIRHTWRTVADETRDFPAIDLIMGHADNSMAAAYRERIGDERLIAVVSHVRGFLFPTAGSAAGEGYKM